MRSCDGSLQVEHLGTGTPDWLDVIAAGAAVSLIGGFSEVAVHLGRRHVLQGFVFMSADSVWLTPLVTLLLMVPLILVLVSARALTPNRVGWKLVVAVPATVAAFGLLFLLFHNRLYPAAQLVFAAGIGHASGRFAANRPRKARAMSRGAALVLGAASLLLAMTVPLWQGVRERRRIDALAQLPPGTPNVLLIILDTVRAASLSLYGYHKPTTPFLERRAGEGVTFDRAIAPAPWTLPTHASIFTGHWPQFLSVDWETALDRRYPTVAELLAARGYATAGFVANLFYTSRESGLARGFHRFEDYQLVRRQLLLSSGAGQWIEEQRTGWHPARWTNVRKSAGVVTGQFLRWIDQPRSAPFFAFLNYFDAHEPYAASPDWVSRFRTDTGRVSARDRYDASIAMLDQELDSLFRQLEERGILDETIVIVTSDHGEMFNEHQLSSHGTSLYREETEVPLVLWGPGVPAGRRISGPVSLRDLAATIADLAGVTESAVPGASLAAHWRQGDAPSTSPAFAMVTRPRILSDSGPVARGTMVSLLDGPLHFIRNGDGEEELYDLSVDPAEEHNLAGFEAHRMVVREFRESVQRIHSPPR